VHVCPVVLETSNGRLTNYTGKAAGAEPMLLVCASTVLVGLYFAGLQRLSVAPGAVISCAPGQRKGASAQFIGLLALFVATKLPACVTGCSF
jgi:hypothetical protein